jgi:uncharacterized protein YjiS (DUF1127 family)
MKTSFLDQSLISNSTTTAQGGFGGAVSGFVNGLRRAASNRALNRQLSEMDDTLLRDIGLGEDEIYRLRAGSSIKLQNWR